MDEDVQIACVEVTDRRPDGISDPPNIPGAGMKPYFRTSEETLELACGEPDPEAAEFDGLTWAAETLDVELPPGYEPEERIPPMMDLRWRIEEGEDRSRSLTLRLTANHTAFEYRVPEGLSTLAVAEGTGILLWNPEMTPQQTGRDDAREHQVDLEHLYRHAGELLVCIWMQPLSPEDADASMHCINTDLAPSPDGR